MGAGRYPYGRGGSNTTQDLVSGLGLYSMTAYRDVFFVDGNDTNASTSVSAGDKANPFSTVEAALDNATTDCTILIAPGHTETLTGASQWDFATAGIQLIGLGQGQRRPRITMNNTAATIAFSVSNQYMENIIIQSSLPVIVDAVIIEDGIGNITIKACEWGYITEGTDEFIDCISMVNNNSNVLIQDCTFDMGEGNDGAVAAIHLDADTESVSIINCEIHGDYSTACIVGDTTLSQELHIFNCKLQNGSTDNIGTEPCIELLTGTSGIIADTYIMCNVASDDASCVGDTMVHFNNVYSETIDSGVGIATAAGTTLTA